MNWLTNTLASSLGKKLLMALTGFFLILFLTGHLIGNLQLLIPGETGKLQFNAYAEFMTSNPAIKLLSYLTYISIVAHVVYALILTNLNKRARGTTYVYSKVSAGTSWSSRNMGILGTLVLVFIIVHLKGFWFEMHWGGIPMDTNGNKDLHRVVVTAYTEGVYGIPGIVYVIFYVISMVMIAFHLFHGFSSAFQTLGFNHGKYMPLIRALGIGLC